MRRLCLVRDFDALGGARPPFFLLLAQKKEGKEKGTPRLGLRCAPTALRASAQDRRCGSASADNKAPALFLQSPIAQTVLALIGLDPAVLGCAKG
jgi:hypothetical protein